MQRRELWHEKVLLIILLAVSFFLLGIQAKANSSGYQSMPQASIFQILSLGESTKLQLPSDGKIHISDGSVVRARKVGTQMVLTGKKIGRAELRFINNTSEAPDQTLYVTDRKTAATAKQFTKFLTNTRGLYLDVSALPNLIVRGELLRLEDWLLLAEVARAHQTPWQLQADVLPRQKLRNSISQELKHLAWAADLLRIETSGLSIVTNREKGTVSNQDTLQLSTLGIRVDFSSSINDLEPMIRTQVVIAEVRRSTVQKLGIKWPTSLQIGGQTTVIDISSVKADLEAIEQNGEGRILAMPNLLCRSGGEAKFFAGGEIPFRTSHYRSTNVEWKKYGINLHVQPRADRIKRLKFQLITEISAIDDSMKSEDGIPGVTSNRIETQFNLAGPQTVALSGLIKREEGKHLSSLGLLNSIPILGRLFESHDFRNSITELVIFLTPEITFPGSSDGSDQ
jgi:pilus assembly protein CpaC